MANNANSTLTTDLSVEPYFDDYDASKNFYRILYKPARPVQGRELNQMQSLQQKQIDRLGKHLFREGSIVLPGQFDIELDLDYVKVRDIDNANTVVSIDAYLGQTIQGVTNGVSAYVLNVEDGTETTSNTKTIFVRYLSSSNSNTQINTFQAGEVLTCNAGTLIANTGSNTTGKGSRFVISEGVFFAKEHFISFDTQSIILDKYGTRPTTRVGFSILEEIVDYTTDLSLLDPALESSNYSAPGADRLKLTPLLTKFDIDDDTGAPDFVELFTIQDGVVTELYERSQYNILRDELAKRTLDESGDYYVRGLGIRVRENLDTGTNGGFSNTGNSQLLSIGVEPGIAYVKGYEVGKLVTDYVTTEKSENFENVATQIATITMGSYITANQFMGFVDHDKGTLIQLRDTAQRKISTGGAASDVATGSVIGLARVKTIEYDSGLLGTETGNVKIYLFDVKMNGTNSFSNTRTLHTTNFYADVILDSSGYATLIDTASDTLLYYVGSPAVRNLKDISGNPSVNFNFKRTSDVTIISAGAPVNLPISTSGETFPYGTVGSLSTEDKRDIIVTIKNSSFNITGTGTVANVGNTTLLGTGTSFTRFNAGDRITFSGNSKSYIISSIANNTYLYTTERLPNLSGASFFKAYKAGDQIDLNGIGFAAGATRTVAATPTTLTFDFKETYPADFTGTVTFQGARADGREISKTLVPSVLVKVNVANSSANVYGPYNLGFSDVYQVRRIIKKTGSDPTSISDGTDVTSQFLIDNGQRDNMYDHATITPRAPLATTDRLLVEFDYFKPSYTAGVGYFSVDSYPIDDDAVSNTTIRTENIPIFVSPISKTQYSLRSFVDFRPVKSNSAIAATTAGTAAANPANSSVFLYEANGMRLPVPSTQFNYDYSYYYARIDLIVLDKDGKVSIVKGIPRANPVTPIAPENVMPLASLFVAPYPSLAPSYAQIINRKDLSSTVKKLSNIRFTMRDVGVLQKRIMNLEYYASLSLLEKAAIDLKVLDEDGLDRFKSGIFVDTFRDHSLGDRLNSDYKIVVDRKEQSIRPIYTMHSHYYDYLSGSNVTKTGDLITLPYTETTYLDQSKVTGIRNIELSSYRFIGNLFLSPEIDVWVDTDYLEDNAVTIGPDANSLPQGIATEWNDWQSKVTGYLVEKQPTRTHGGNDIYSAGGWFTSINHAISDVNNTPHTDQKVTEYTTSTRSGVSYDYNITEDVESLGSRVVDVSLIPYIRPQSIVINGRGLKPTTRLYVYFDGENLSNYVTPITYAEYLLGDIIKTKTNKTYGEGAALNSDGDGDVYFILRLPAEKRFRVGQKEVLVTDSPTNSVDASTFAKDYFVAQGLIQQKQNTILTTRSPILELTPVNQTKSSTKVFYLDNPSCAAYSVFVKTDEGEEGLFLTSVDLFFSAKHPTLGVWVEIREMDSSGGITRTQVPFSEVWVEAADITLSSDGFSNPHKFTFPAPVFLYNNTQYAFVIHTVGINPDTYFWISRLGETDVRTGLKVNARPLTGTFYTTNNNLNWDMVPDIDLRCVFHRAAFTTGVTGEAILGNKPFDKLMVANNSAPLVQYGEGIIGNYLMTLSGNTGNLVVGDRLVGQNSSANSSVFGVNGSVFTVANTQYLLNERVDLYTAGMVSKAQTSLITNISSGSGTLSRYKQYEGNTTVEVVSSNGKFYIGDTIRGSQSGISANVTSIENQRYSVIDFEPTYLNFNNTTTQFFMQTTSNTGVAGSYSRVNENHNYYFDSEMALFSRTNEIDDLSGERSNKVKVHLSTTTEYLSPVFDLGRTHTVYVDSIINILDASDVSEANTSGGGLINKYISQPVILAEGQDAEDILVQLTAYRPPNSDIRVWVKIIHAEDSDTFAQARWRELEKTVDRTYSSLADRNNFKEYSYKFPAAMLTGPATDNSPGGEVQYTNSQGITFTGYKYFAVKIGLEASNSAVVPRVADLRVIALQI